MQAFKYQSKRQTESKRAYDGLRGGISYAAYSAGGVDLVSNCGEASGRSNLIAAAAGRVTIHVNGRDQRLWAVLSCRLELPF